MLAMLFIRLYNTMQLAFCCTCLPQYDTKYRLVIACVVYCIQNVGTMSMPTSSKLYISSEDIFPWHVANAGLLCLHHGFDLMQPISLFGLINVLFFIVINNSIGLIYFLFFIVSNHSMICNVVTLGKSHRRTVNMCNDKKYCEAVICHWNKGK